MDLIEERRREEKRRVKWRGVNGGNSGDMRMIIYRVRYVAKYKWAAKCRIGGSNIRNST